MRLRVIYPGGRLALLVSSAAPLIGHAKGSSQVGGGPEISDGEDRCGGGGGAREGSRGRTQGEQKNWDAGTPW